MKNKKIIFASIIVVLLVILSLGILAYFILDAKKNKRYWTWDPAPVTFYSQMPIPDMNNEDWDGTIDSGFNELVFNGALDYSTFKNKSLKEKSEISVTSSTTWTSDGSNYTDPEQPGSIWYEYKNGITNTMVSSGFNIGQAFQKLYADENFVEEAKNGGWKQIVADDTTLLGKDHEAATSIVYEANSAGFIAGLAGATYLTSQIYQYGKDVKTDDITVWGGVPFNTVYDWLSGFEQGVNYFNYKVLGYDISGKALTTATNSWLLQDAINKKLGTATDIFQGSDFNNKGGIDLSNGFEYKGDSEGIDINYSSAVKADNEQKSNVKDYDNKKGWYTGGFGTQQNLEEPTDNGEDSVSAHNAKDRAESAVEYSPVIFPVAGGQTEITSIVLNDHKGSTNKLIGVDTDATVSDSAHADKYIGSATKNLQASTSLATWYVDRFENVYNSNNNAASKEIGKTSFGGISASNFMSDYDSSNPESKGWKVNDSTYKGNVFKGSYSNGGVQFVQAGNEINEAWNIIKSIQPGISMPETFDEFVAMAFEDQTFVGGIENSSNTFAPKGTAHITTHNDKYPWTPDWGVYQ